MTSPELKVYRLQGIPEHLDRLGVAELVSSFIPGGDQRDVLVASLASVCELWVRPRTKTATLSFRRPPEAVRDNPEAGEWSFQVLALPKPLILDDTFYGLTPLNDVPEHRHKYDCIVMSGLASHPMGSWQPHGKPKSFMWIRDGLPGLVQGVKFILYGYDTKLVGNKSFQTVSDISLSFIHTLQQAGWATPGSRNVVFFAHSLGGVVLKEAFRMVADSGVRGETILNRTKGVIFFGVPSRGLDVSDLRVMLGDQANKHALVKEISTESLFLETLEEQFSGISQLQRMKLHWAYETETTPTVVMANGKYERSGPGTTFVSPLSATSNRHNSDSDSIIQINTNHSDMVKFSQGDKMIDRIAYTLRSILRDDNEILSPELDVTIAETSAFMEPAQRVRVSLNHADPTANPDFWYIYSVLESIHSHERDSRLEQTEIAAGRSFEWAFENSSVGLTDWLQTSNKAFWISGKPASGKSTFMKYLHENPLTLKYLRKWRRSSNYVQAVFFFHHRGTAIQKSIEGLLRGILSHILQQAPQAFSLIQPLLQQAYHKAVESANLRSLSLDLEALIEWSGASVDAKIEAEAQKILNCEMQRTAFQTLVVKPLLSMGFIDNDFNLERQIYSHLQELQSLQNLLEVSILSEEEEERAYAERNFANYAQINFKLIAQKIDKSWAVTEKFTSLLKGWLVATNLALQLWNFKQVLMDRIGKRILFSEQVEVQLDSMVKEIIARSSARQRQRQRIETANNQPGSFLFVDALDEHDGPPAFISQIIEDMIDSEGSKTRMKIMFSSRRWDAFINAFGQYPGIQIHDYTEDDIREICVQRVPPGLPGSREILNLTEEIVRRARGVFLWVKLVLHDLLQHAASLSTSGHDVGELDKELVSILNSLPNDLEEYYKTIIERIPYSSRWQTFCLLEVVSKSREAVFLDEVAEILITSKINTIDDIYRLKSSPNLKYADLQVSTHLGGLVETIAVQGDIYSPMEGKFLQRNQLQLLHQTVAEFVQRPEFRYIVLGERCRITEDNGHTLLVKHKLFQGAAEYQYGGGWQNKYPTTIGMDNTLLYYAHEAEKTTGKSLYPLLKGIAWNVGRDNPYIPYRLSQMFSAMEFRTLSPLEMGLAGVLELFLKEYLQNGQADLSTRFPRLVFVFLHLIYSKRLDVQQALNTLKNMVTWGLRVESILDGLLTLLSDPANHEFSLGLDTDLNIGLEFGQQVMEMFFSPGFNFPTDYEPDLNMDKRPSSSRTWIEHHGTKGSIQPLHICHLDFAEYLLEKGADPNGLTSKKWTPLDFQVTSCLSSDGVANRDLILLLIRHGGRLNICTRKEWKQLMQKFRDHDANFQRPSFPGSLDQAPSLNITERIKSWPKNALKGNKT